MCGICGYMSPIHVPEKQLFDMTNAAIHRGPDDGGIWMYEDNGYYIGFGHRRLSIFDLSALGHQPMETSDGSISVTYNGEIYNFCELRRELENEGYAFRSDCDTEVLLYAYQKWGDDCISRFNGMFAFALFDKQNHRAILARDRMGKKPLYYYHKGQTFIFGSELKSIMKHPEFSKEINREMIPFYLSNMCFHAPYTVFENTYKLKPGCMLIWENGSITTRIYWNLLEKHREMCKSLVTDAVEAKEGLKAHIRRSVKQRLAADVPVGVFLSGGIDSAVTAGTAADITDVPIKTFSIGFFKEELNEAARAKEVAHHLGTHHTELYITEEEALTLTAEIPLYYDEPFADSSQIPTMLVSRLARQVVTVALSGDGGDELFCGYPRYDNKSAKKAVAGLIANIAKPFATPGLTGILGAGLLPAMNGTPPGNRHLRKSERMQESVNFAAASKLIKGNITPITYDAGAGISNLSRQERCMLHDMLAYLPDDILCKVDRASMRYALELRCPLLDVNVVEYSFRIPLSILYHNNEKKWLLKQVAYDYVPQKLLDMPKKGFNIPVKDWLRGPLSSMVSKYTNADILKKQDVFEANHIQWLADETSSNKGHYCSMLWSFLMFQLWYQCYIEDLW